MDQTKAVWKRFLFVQCFYLIVIRSEFFTQDLDKKKHMKMVHDIFGEAEIPSINSIVCVFVPVDHLVVGSIASKFSERSYFSLETRNKTPGY